MRSALILLAVLPLAACGVGDTCEDSVASRIASPDGKHDAVLFNRDCGAATGASTQISILPAGAKPEGKGNVFIADGEHGAAPASWGGPWAAMRWTAPDRLEITFDRIAGVYLQEMRTRRGVKIDWRTASPPPGATTP